MTNNPEFQFSPPGDQATEAVLPSSQGHAPLSGGSGREETPTSDDDDGRSGLPSASAMDRIIHCPGSRAMERGLPPLASTEATETGEKVHESMETGEDEDLGLTEREIKERLVAMERAALAQWREDFGIDEEPTIVRERRYWMRDDALEPIASGKVDFSAFTSTHALILDYKTGFADPTDSERNWQCRTQTACFWTENRGIEHVRAGIVANRLYSKLDTTDYTLDDIRRVHREIHHGVWRSEQPGAPRVPGDHCRWCRANGGHCRESVVYGPLMATAGVPEAAKDDQLAIIAAVDRMTPAQLRYIYDRKSFTKVVFEAVDARLKLLSESALNGIGLALVPGNKTYPIKDVPAAFDKLSDLLTDEERKRVIKITRGEVEKIVADKKHITKSDAKKLVIETLGLEEKEGNKKLKPI